MNQNPNMAKPVVPGTKNESETWAISDHNLFGTPVYIFGKPVARDILFSNYRGIYKKKIENRQRRLLIKIPFINSFLEDGELITLITSGYAPLTRLERFLLRYLTVFQRRALFVFTDRRVFYIPTTFSYGYRYAVAEIRYGNCKSIQVIGRSLVFMFHKGGFKKFPYIRREERRKVKALVEKLILGMNPSGTQNMTCLCARCHTSIPNNSAYCPKCRLRFWTSAKAGMMALLAPGGGYFYINNTLYGFASAIMELLLTTLLILSVIDMYQGFKGSVLTAAMLCMIFAGIKAVSFFHSRDLAKGCFPVMGQLSSVKIYPKLKI
jgi:hypothetical protein